MKKSDKKTVTASYTKDLTFTTSLFILAKRLPENSRLKELRDTLFNFSFNEYLRLAVIFSHTLAIIWTTAILSEYPKI